MSVERQSLLSQSKFLHTSEKELAQEKLPTPIQKKNLIQVKITCRLPENKVVEERFDIETKMKDVKARIYDLAIKAIETLETVDNYVLEFTDTKIYVLKENLTLVCYDYVPLEPANNFIPRNRLVLSTLNIQSTCRWHLDLKLWTSKTSPTSSILF